jgi:hypothetical protein
MYSHDQVASSNKHSSPAVLQAKLESYILRGGAEGRARLQKVARVMAPLTRALLNRRVHCQQFGNEPEAMLR